VIKRASNRLKSGLIVGRLLPAYVLLGLVKHIVPLKWLARWAWCPPVGPRDREAERRLAASVSRLSQLAGLPDRDCLQRSLLLYRVLSRAGAEPTLVVGFDRINGRVLGHAWVIMDGHAVIERETDLLRFSPTFSFGSRGTLLSEWPDPRAA
jgi:Transglutaminase-like superfamily